jgi:hypothetical protein
MKHKLKKKVLKEILNKYSIGQENRQNIIHDILDYMKNGTFICNCEHTVQKTELNTFPYGTNFSYEECTNPKCKKHHNIKVF